MFFSMRSSLDKIIVALLCFQSVVAVPAGPTTPKSSEVDLFKRQGVNASPCYPRLNLGKGSGMQAAKDFQYTSAPWFPNCLSIPSTEGKAKCLACMSIAGGVYYNALGGCTAASTACAVGAWACESVCIAAATYALWVAEQACYCEHADCSDPAVRNKGRIGSPPEIVVAEQPFRLPLPNGWGYVGTRKVFVTPFGTPYKAIKCQ